MRPSSVARRWIVAAASASFAAGLAVGLFAPAIVQAVAPEDALDRNERYVRELSRAYDLAPDQIRVLRVILEEREREKERLLHSYEDRLPEALRTELSREDRRAQKRIKYVLTDEQRERFLRDLELSPEETGTDRGDPREPQDR